MGDFTFLEDGTIRYKGRTCGTFEVVDGKAVIDISTATGNKAWAALFGDDNDKIIAALPSTEPAAPEPDEPETQDTEWHKELIAEALANDQVVALKDDDKAYFYSGPVTQKLIEQVANIKGVTVVLTEVGDAE